MSFAEAASIPGNFLTAYYALHHLAEISAGDRVLIHAAAGGTGMAAVQIAQNAGAEVFATASPPKWETLRQMGVQHVMNSRTVEFADQIMESTQGKGVNIVLNSLTSGEFISKSLSVLSPQGKFVELAVRDIWDPEQMKQNKSEIALVRAESKLQDIMKLELSIHELFTFPTIQELAQHLSERSKIETAPHESNSTVNPVREAAPTVSDCLVPLQTEGDRLPFFCVHPFAGVVFPYVELALILGHNQPFYGLQSLGLNPGQMPQTSIGDMAAAYIAAIKTVQPRGPYRMGGWSMGSPIALEMAWQLQQEGETVDRLVLIDTPVTATAIADLPFIFGQFLPDIWPYVAGYVRLQLQPDHSTIATPDHRPKFPALLATWMNRLSSLIGSSLHLAAVCQANTQALWHYTPSYYDGQITLLRTDNRSLDKLLKEPTWGWQQFSSQAVQVHLLPGSHMTLLRSPHVQQLAFTLQTCLQQPQ
ncbi:MAG: zinc-binding dehydrogenase [Hormoscilla sp. GUM202]|nr:zinc-binding dehydrogenase [Hormoscilla sp. GUM202]